MRPLPDDDGVLPVVMLQRYRSVGRWQAVDAGAWVGRRGGASAGDRVARRPDAVADLNPLESTGTKGRKG